MLHPAPLLALTLAAPSLADVLDVDPVAGPYTEIRDAVAAAQPGDVVRVTTGTYEAFGVFGKGLYVVPRSPASNVRVVGAVRVQDLPADQEVVLDSIHAVTVAGAYDHGLTIANCDGPVRIDRGTYYGAEGRHVRVLDSADVVLVEIGDYLGDVCLLSRDSELTVFGGSFVGRSYIFHWNYLGYPGGTPIVVEGGSLHAHGSEIRGGHGGDDDGSQWGCNTYSGDGGDGIRATDATVRVTDCQISGGVTGDCYWCCGWDGVPVNALGSSTVTYEAGTKITAGVSETAVREGDTLLVNAAGDSGDALLLIVGSEATRRAVPGFDGDLLVGGPLGGTRRALIGASPAALPLTMPPLPPFAVETFHLQIAQLQSSGLVLGPTVTVHALDSAW